MHLFACKRLVPRQDNAEPRIGQEESSGIGIKDNGDKRGTHILER
jgi:hypothetical protein